jgi:hypothetical protein
MHDILLIVISYAFLPVSCGLLVILLFPFPEFIQNIVVKFDLAVSRLFGAKFMMMLVVGSGIVFLMYGY